MRKNLFLSLKTLSVVFLLSVFSLSFAFAAVSQGNKDKNNANQGAKTTSAGDKVSNKSANTDLPGRGDNEQDKDDRAEAAVPRVNQLERLAVNPNAVSAQANAAANIAAPKINAVAPPQAPRVTSNPNQALSASRAPQGAPTIGVPGNKSTVSPASVAVPQAPNNPNTGNPRNPNVNNPTNPNSSNPRNPNANNPTNPNCSSPRNPNANNPTNPNSGNPGNPNSGVPSNPNSR